MKSHRRRNLLFILLLSLDLLYGCAYPNKSFTTNSVTSSGFSAETDRLDDRQLYLGQVIGMSMDSFSKTNFQTYSKEYPLDKITKSAHKIEVRFYGEQNYSPSTRCVVIYFDSFFTVRAWNLVHSEERDKQSMLKESKVKGDPAAVFAKLIENGIFSLAAAPAYPDYDQYPALAISENGFEEVAPVRVNHGYIYHIEYKVDTLFNRIEMAHPEMSIRYAPDFQTYRRMYEITEQFLSFVK